MLKSLFLWLGYGLVRLLHATYRFHGAEAAARNDGRYILAIWHQHLFSGILGQTGRAHAVIISRSRDGDPVSYLCTRLGHRVLRGSSRKGQKDKGGKQAKDEMIAVMQEGLPGAVTVDGPSGPAHKVKPGIIEMARITGLPIVPYTALPTRYWTFPSWDAFRLPKPFTRIELRYGAPLQIPADTAFAGFEHYQDALAAALCDLEQPCPREKSRA